jgi:hypothetical protein
VEATPTEDSGIDASLARQDERWRPAMELLRSRCLALRPERREGIACGMPTSQREDKVEIAVACPPPLALRVEA